MIETDSEGFITGDLEIPEGEFAVWGVAHANTGHAEDLEELYSRTMRHALTEPGISHYCICRVDGTNLFHFFERYASKAAFEAHVKLPTMHELFSRDLMRGCTDVAFAAPGSLPAPRDSMSVEDVKAVDTEKYQAYLDQLGPLPDEEFAIYGTVHASPEHTDAQAQSYADATKLASTAPGVIYYCVLRDSDDASKFHIFERYAGKRAFGHFYAQPVIHQAVAGGTVKDSKMVVSKPILLAT